MHTLRIGEEVVAMTTAEVAQLKVMNEAAELAKEQPDLDLTAEARSRRLTYEESTRLIRERYSTAIALLGKL